VSEQSFTGHSHAHRGVLERISSGLFATLEHASHADDVAAKKGLLQPLDPRVKLLGLLALIVAAVFSRSLVVLYGLFMLAMLLALFSAIPLRSAMLRVWLSVLLFPALSVSRPFFWYRVTS